MHRIWILFFILIFVACEQDTIPKPKGYLSLVYPKKSYEIIKIKRPYSFFVLKGTIIKDEKYNWLKIKYPDLKGSVDITYRPIENNLQELLVEAQKLVFKHTIKAEEIIPRDFVDTKKKVYGSLYQITGNAASQIQFHATDSVHHFIKGSLYFYAKPNYDSILPAMSYIKKDIIKLIETLEWKNS